jgi:hypothetical protein
MARNAETYPQRSQNEQKGQYKIICDGMSESCGSLAGARGVCKALATENTP